MRKAGRFSMLLLTVLFLCLILSEQGIAKQLFSDDFEQDVVGEEPSKWEAREGVHVARVIEDPADPGNKIFEMTNRLNGSDEGRYYVAGDASWTDYIFEWDWMQFEDGYRGMIFRYQDRDNFYIVDRRLGGVEIQLYSRVEGAWVLLASGEYPNEVGVWYRCRFEAMGDTLTFKIKAQDDGTSFSDIAPLLEGTDGSFSLGGVATGGAAYIDNVVAGETEGDLASATAVKPIDKLASTWGEMKSK